jgi:hypothetical protein
MKHRKKERKCIEKKRERKKRGRKRKSPRASSNIGEANILIGEKHFNLKNLLLI